MRILKKKLLFSLVSEQNFLIKAEGYGYKDYGYLYFRLSEFEKGSVRDAASRLVKAGLVDRIVRSDESRFRITAMGREKLLEDLMIYRGQRRVWDRRWRIVIVGKLGKDLRTVQRKLANLGYKRVARGVYITPLSVSEETKSFFLSKTWTVEVQMIESRKLIVGDDWQLARRLWKLDKQGEKYADFVRESELLLKMGRRNIMLLRQAKKGFKQMFDRYFWLLQEDAGMPKKLLPADWQADKAREVFLRLVELGKTANL